MAHVNAIFLTRGRQPRSYPMAYISDDDQAHEYATQLQERYDKIKAVYTVTVLPIEINTLKALW